MSKDTVKVVGYAKKSIFNDGIEYRDFAPDLVGNQLTSDNTTPLFTYGNFAILKNIQIKSDLVFPTKPFSNFYTLTDLSGQPSTNVSNNNNNNTLLTNLVFNTSKKVKLNIDGSDISNFAYFGSSTEFIRVTLENIITKWPASVFVTPLNTQTQGALHTVQNYNYDSYLNFSTFRISTNSLNNKYDIIYNTGSSLLTEYNSETRSLITNYPDYVIDYNNTEYPLIGFTGSTQLFGDFVYLKVKGNPFSGVTSPYISYHIRPNNVKINEFFIGLDPFENNLLNRLTTPKYKATFNTRLINDNGVVVETTEDATWPTTDGYNIDFNTNEYISYASKLLTITENLDLTKTDLIVRFLVAEAISNFDTLPTCEGVIEETAGQKMTKTLRIYGRVFDEVKKYIDAIAYSNTVTYNKKNNTPDVMVKYLARTLGWELVSSILENDLIKSYLTNAPSTYSGQTIGLTPAEAEVELWRRLILNSAWLFKSKGTRKAVEFLFKFIGMPEGLINLNEYIYVAKEPIDMQLFFDALDENELATDLGFYSVDENGYPKPLNDTFDLYFQKGGLWYRETGGNNASTHITTGNNPHLGPYDGGNEYINQFRNLTPNLQQTILTSSTFTNTSTELFTNYNNGLMNNYSGDTYVGLESWDGVNLDDCYLYESEIISDPHPTPETTDCGCDLPEEDLSLYIDVKRDEYTQLEQLNKCSNRLTGYTYVESGELFYNKPFIYNWNYLTYDISNNPIGYYTSQYVSPTCCKSIVDGLSYLHDEYIINEDTGKPILLNSGYVCCKKLPIIDTPTPVDSFTTFGFNGNQPKTLNINRAIDCGCYLACQWRLAGPTIGHMYSLNGNTYLKFVTPKNNWGQSGQPEYRVTTQSDECFCPTSVTTPEYITDPYTNKKGFGCKLKENGVSLLTLQTGTTNGTTDNALYKMFIDKSNGDISCTSFPKLEEIILVG